MLRSTLPLFGGKVWKKHPWTRSRRLNRRANDTVLNSNNDWLRYYNDNPHNRIPHYKAWHTKEVPHSILQKPWGNSFSSSTFSGNVQ
jgi:hypothetical protein